ncbi:RND family transporter [Candidatus Omnitrophota bacterium]
MFKRLILFSVNHPKLIIILTIVISALAIIQFPKIKIDTDPENMLSKEEFVRIFHDQVKKEFSLYDFIILGIVNEKHPDGVFNIETLGKIYHITNKIKEIDGVIARDIIAPSTKDNISQAGLGAVKFEWLMASPPKTREQALFIKEEAKDNPLFDGTIVSENGKALCIYAPIKKKDMSYRISREMLKIVNELKGAEKYHITGLPVAEDTFGVEMFKQMGVSAPLAGLIIFLLMLFFFRKINLILSPMIVAMATVVITMGSLIGKGLTVHIMSSMIPIFLMPISVVDGVHILSEFHDNYNKIKDKKKTILKVMDDLFMPMLYTSLTSACGFASLAFTPIPPVQVFGIFVAFGVILAWFLTMVFIPAYIMTIKESSLKGFGDTLSEKPDTLTRLVESIGRFSIKRAKIVVIFVIAICAVSIYGITKININDNPVRWFKKSHRIRVADRVLNKHFGGTYTAYLVLDSKKEDSFKDPDTLRYIERLQGYLLETGIVGKSSSLSDVVKKVYYELMDGDKENYNRIPDSSAAVAQCLISFQNSHKPDDLWHLVTPDYSKINIWVQLKSGDNQDMGHVVKSVSHFIKDNPPPLDVKTNWAGLTYINTVWQDRMVSGMLKSLFSAFIIVFFMMMFLFRSPLWGILAMVPLSMTILFIYGLIGLVGKDYDMPVAVLSSLTLGISVDFAIHFLQRTKMLYSKHKNWKDSAKELFEEPARAISRNAIVVAIGFFPLLLAPLMPYRTVGFFIASIMAVSSLATFFILPAGITLMEKMFFKKLQSPGCNCLSCVIISFIVSALMVGTLYSFRLIDIKMASIVSLAIVVLMSVFCNRLSRREVCKGGK